MRVCNCSMFCCTLLYVHSSIAIILMWKTKLAALLNLSSRCLVMVEWLFFAVPWGCLRFVIVVFPDHTHLLFLSALTVLPWLPIYSCFVMRVTLQFLIFAPLLTFVMSLSDDNQLDIFDAFNTIFRYLDDILNIYNVYFDNKVSQILQLNRTNTSDPIDAFLDLHLSISNDIVSTKIYDKRDDFDFEIVNFLFLDGDVPRSTSYGVYISQLIRFARASSHVADFNTHNKLLTQKLF